MRSEVVVPRPCPRRTHAPAVVAAAGERRTTTPVVPPRRAACARGETTDLLAEICEEGTLTVSTDPAYPPQSSLNEQTRRVRGLRHRRRHRDRQPARRRRRVGDARLGRHHRRQLERPLGHHRRLDDADERPAGGPLLHRAVQLHAGRGRGPEDNDDGHRPHHRPRRQEDRRLQRLHLRAVPRTRTLDIEGYTFDFVIDDAEVPGYDTDTTALQDLRQTGGSTR